MKIFHVVYTIFLCVSGACSGSGKIHADANREAERLSVTQLRDSLQVIADSFPGEIGVAVITDRGDTLCINNETKYPLMSVFKLHQAVALCDLFEKRGGSLDSVVNIPRMELNPDTWSPMLKDHTEEIISIPIHELLTYTLTQSDNNASNWMFENLQPVEEVDSFIASIIPRESFLLRYTEGEMGRDHSLAYKNCSSPLGAAELINQLYSDSIIGEEDAQFIRATLENCHTGEDRLAAPLKNKSGIIIGHKTGSGYRNSEGVLAAHNDIGFIRLPDGRHYSIAVFVKDFRGSEEEAAKVIALISEKVLNVILNPDIR